MTESARLETPQSTGRDVVPRDGTQNSSEIASIGSAGDDGASVSIKSDIETSKEESERAKLNASRSENAEKTVHSLVEEQHSQRGDSTHHSVSEEPGVSIVGSRDGPAGGEDGEKSLWKTRILTLLDDQWFLICMGILIVLASQVQVPQSQQTIKSRIISYLCVCIIFFATGCTLDTGILVRNYARWKAHLWVQGQCFLLCSAIMFGIVSATATKKEFMDPGLLVGLVFMSCIPTTLASNVVMTAQAKGNQELTVVQVTLGNFIGESKIAVNGIFMP